VATPSTDPRRFGPSLPARIFVAFAAIVAVSGLATFYGAAGVAALRHELRFLRVRALPVRDELRRSALELRAFDEALQRAAPHDLEWVVRFAPNARPFARIDGLLQRTRSLRELAAPPRLARLVPGDPLPVPRLDARLAAIRAAHAERDRMIDDTDLLRAAPRLRDANTDAEAFAALVRALTAAVTDKRSDDAARLVVEIRRTIRHVHGALDDAEREFDAALAIRFSAAERSETRLQVLVLVAPGMALAVSVALLFWMLWSLRPLAALTGVVRRFAGGDRTARAEVAGAAEIGTLALEWNRMADALALRETQLAAQQTELVQAERLAALGHMAAQMAHEVRNPLSSIGLNAELIDEELQRDGGVDVQEARDLVAAIIKEVNHLRTLTGQHLDRARRWPSEHARVDLGALCRTLCDFAESELARRGVRCQVDVRGPGLLQGDAGQLRQALWNLVRNAWEAMPGGGRLWVDVAAAADGDGKPWVVLAVEDSGPGVPALVRDQLFQPFVTTKESGTGLGLALVREVAEAHRGKVALAQGRHGDGARFELTLPAGDQS
jgi:signal transduction histidine kinase